MKSVNDRREADPEIPSTVMGSGPKNRNNPGEFRQADSVVMATLNSWGIWEADTLGPHQF